MFLVGQYYTPALVHPWLLSRQPSLIVFPCKLYVRREKDLASHVLCQSLRFISQIFVLPWTTSKGNLIMCPTLWKPSIEPGLLVKCLHFLRSLSILSWFLKLLVQPFSWIPWVPQNTSLHVPLRTSWETQYDRCLSEERTFHWSAISLI